MSGWIKLYRELLDKPIWKQSRAEHACILMTLLMMVNHKEEEWLYRDKKMIASPGQTVTSLDSILRNCPKGIEIGQIRRALDRFEKLGFLTNESTSTGRLITILNWELYQGADEKPTDETAKHRQSTDKVPTPNKNDKNDKNDKKNISPLPPKPKEEKNQYAEFVSMTEKEYNSLSAQYGEKGAREMIVILDNYKGADPKKRKYGSDYRAILSWVVKRWQEDNGRGSTGAPREEMSFAEKVARGIIKTDERGNVIHDLSGDSEIIDIR